MMKFKNQNRLKTVNRNLGPLLTFLERTSSAAISKAIPDINKLDSN